MKEQNTLFGIAWYRKEQWELLKSTAADFELIEDTFEEWEKNAKKALRNLRKEGANVIKVDFDVEEFNEWCKKNNKRPDTRTRSDYVAYLLREKYNK